MQHSSGWQLDPEPSLRGYQVEWEEEGELLVSRRNELYRTVGPAQPLLRVGAFPAGRWKPILTRVRSAQRLLRFLFYNVIKLQDGRIFASFDKSVGLLRHGGFEPISGLIRPCRILRSGCAVGADGNVYFGEYLQNPRHDEEIHLYRFVPKQGRLEVVRRFPSGFVRHIHGIHRDPFTDDLWCVNGDLDSECRMLRSHDGFETFDTIGQGDETWRCVGIVFTKRAIYYATDSEFVRNRIYRIDRSTGERRNLGEIDGPVYVGKAVGENVFFAVTAELCPSQVGRSATLWHVDEQDRLAQVASFSKDAMHVAYFMVGTLNLARGPGFSDRFYLHGVALRNADNCTFLVQRGASAGEPRSAG